MCTSKSLEASSLEMELQRFFAETIEPKPTNVLQFWKSQCMAFPTLGVMAHQYLTIPATSAPLERIFSCGRKILSYQRASLSAMHIEQLARLKDWAQTFGRIIRLDHRAIPDPGILLHPNWFCIRASVRLVPGLDPRCDNRTAALGAGCGWKVNAHWAAGTRHFGPAPSSLPIQLIDNTSKMSSGSYNESAQPVTISEIIQQQSSLESEAAEVLPFDITRCSRPLGPLRQSIYSCLTCNPIGDGDSHVRAGLCVACSVSCHVDHQLVELCVRRHFQCDCGTSRCGPGKCQLNPISMPDDELEYSAAPSNKYDKNFDGHFCICERGKQYDPETETDDMYQCLACEDWRHSSCLGPHPDPDDWDAFICAECVKTNRILRTLLLKHAGGKGNGMMVLSSSEADRVSTFAGRLLTPPLKSIREGSYHEAMAQPQESFLYSDAPRPEAQETHRKEISKTELQTISKPTNFDGEDISGGQAEHLNNQPSNNILLANECKYQDQSPKDKASQLKRATSVDIIAQDLDSKRPRLIPPTSSPTPHCTAPFQNDSESPLARLDQKFANVFLAPGWRDQWCKCSTCLALRSTFGWLESEEDVWEPGEDKASTKSLLELGIEAFHNLPRGQMIEGLYAYNKLRDEMMDFLKPFASTNTLVTEDDIKAFFSDAKSKIKNKAW
ncbi:hypothetical protein O181_035436 [Austropuccinia psidii MF-1]|uniref:UBR-type domain-containing protein n=1 Tax=Austropuccinia psidii MF-1 TaxID=1389203 RepID=A0A9Q3D2M5_9BASI|nr:hypothetical protein [Austropuccinia psidii MF-1]